MRLTSSLGLQKQFQTLSTSASRLETVVPPEIIAYVEDGRNPDIYTREFVELVQKSNMYLKGKSQAFGDFKHILGQQMVDSGLAESSTVAQILSSRVEVPS